MTEPNRLTAPEVKDFERLVLPPETVEEISPRITLHTVNVGTQPINRVTVIFERGNLTQGKDYCVASGMLPRILTEGTTTMSGAEIATVIDTAGAWMVPQSMIHHSVISLTSLNDVTPALLDIVTDVLLSSSALVIALIWRIVSYYVYLIGGSALLPLYLRKTTRKNG